MMEDTSQEIDRTINLDSPIVVLEGEGNDRPEIPDTILTPERLVDLAGVGLQVRNVYKEGTSRYPGIADPTIFPNGVGAPNEVLVTESVAEKLLVLQQFVRQSGVELVVFSGFISPELQQRKWQEIYKMALNDLAAKGITGMLAEVLAGRRGDVGGSVADAVCDSIFDKKLGVMLARHSSQLDETLAQIPDDVPVTREALAREILKYRANLLGGDAIDYSSATTIHNNALSVNLGLADSKGNLLNMGAGLDSSSCAQAVDYFEGRTAEEYINEVEQNPEVARYLDAQGVSGIDSSLINVIAGNRRLLFNAVRAVKGSNGRPFFGFYKGEQGHFTGEVNGRMNRQEAYRQVRA